MTLRALLEPPSPDLNTEHAETSMGFLPLGVVTEE